MLVLPVMLQARHPVAKAGGELAKSCRKTGITLLQCGWLRSPRAPELPMQLQNPQFPPGPEQAFCTLDAFCMADFEKYLLL
jgi:hypothetical protein